MSKRKFEETTTTSSLGNSYLDILETEVDLQNYILLVEGEENNVKWVEENNVEKTLSCFTYIKYYNVFRPKIVFFHANNYISGDEADKLFKLLTNRQYKTLCEKVKILENNIYKNIINKANNLEI
jgi:hypothetical protein